MITSWLGYRSRCIPLKFLGEKIGAISTMTPPAVPNPSPKNNLNLCKPAGCMRKSVHATLTSYYFPWPSPCTVTAAHHIGRSRTQRPRSAQGQVKWGHDMMSEEGKTAFEGAKQNEPSPAQGIYPWLCNKGFPSASCAMHVP